MWILVSASKDKYQRPIGLRIEAKSENREDVEKVLRDCIEWSYDFAKWTDKDGRFKDFQNKRKF
jgi:hypothetical protein